MQKDKKEMAKEVLNLMIILVNNDATHPDLAEIALANSNFGKNLDDDLKIISEFVNKKNEEKAFSKAELLAIKLHESTCHADHTEDCGWFYEISKDVHDWSRDTHSRYKKKAETILTIIKCRGIMTDVELVTKVIQYLR